MGARWSKRLGIAAVLAVVTAAGALAFGSGGRTAVAQQSLTRYSLVHGCFDVRAAPGGGPVAPGQGPFRLQAAALGVYLLYGPNGTYVIDGGSGSLVSSATPSGAAEWRVDGDSAQGFTMTNVVTGKHLAVAFAPATGCATYPEAEVDASGSSSTGASPESSVLGTVEGHAHVTAYEFLGGDWHCGAPFSPFGAPYALPASCAGDQQGTNGLVENFVDWGAQPRPSDMHGWPTFKEWPSPTALAEEGDYYTGIERAWKAGLRLMVTNLVDNEALCGLMTTKHNPCNDMQAVRIQDRSLHALQDYIDAQAGGPGQGFFRLVTDPFEARQVINQGKLAVVEGIEVSRIFGCGEMYDVPQCDQTQIDAGLKEIHDLGVRTFFPVHEFDNAFGGTKMIAGDTGLIINAGNRLETGSFWTLQSCPAREQDAEQFSVPPPGDIASQLLNGPFASLLHGSPLPVYGSAPQCNTRGLTDLGAYLIRQMIKQHFIIQTDHMDTKTASAAVSIAEANHYAGVVSAHCCSSPQLFKRIYATGGFVNPPVLPTPAAAGAAKLDKAVSDPRYLFGFGWGSDENGLGAQPGPSGAPPVSYPFKSYDGSVTFTREQWGDRTFDFNKGGLANYGMYADWMRQLQSVGGAPVMDDMFRGAEAYLEMWERAYGVPAGGCLPAGQRLTLTGLGDALRLGDGVVSTLYGAGQPLARPGHMFSYCVAGQPAAPAGVTAVFDANGRLAMIVSTAKGDVASGVGPGSPVRRLTRRTRRLSVGVWMLRSRSGTARYLYGVRGGRVSFVAVAATSEISNAATLRADLQAAGA